MVRNRRALLALAVLNSLSWAVSAGENGGKKGKTKKEKSYGARKDRDQKDKPPGKKKQDPAEPAPMCKSELTFTPDETAVDVATLDYCLEHAPYTCCRRPHANRVKSKMNEHAVPMMKSSQCQNLTRSVLCSQCDGDVGTGLLSTKGVIHMCPSFCEGWYYACKDEFWFSRGNAELVPCNNDVGCLTLRDLVPKHDVIEFCESAFVNFHKIEVANPLDEPDLCWDGVPASKTKKGEKWPPAGTHYQRTSTPGFHEAPLSDNIFIRTHQLIYRYLRHTFLRITGHEGFSKYVPYIIAINVALIAVLIHLDYRQGWPLVLGCLSSLGLVQVQHRTRGRGRGSEFRYYPPGDVKIFGKTSSEPPGDVEPEPEGEEFDGGDSDLSPQSSLGGENGKPFLAEAPLLQSDEGSSSSSSKDAGRGDGGAELTQRRPQQGAAIS